MSVIYDMSSRNQSLRKQSSLPVLALPRFSGYRNQSSSDHSNSSSNNNSPQITQYLSYMNQLAPAPSLQLRYSKLPKQQVKFSKTSARSPNPSKASLRIGSFVRKNIDKRVLPPKKTSRERLTSRSSQNQIQLYHTIETYLNSIKSVSKLEPGLAFKLYRRIYKSIHSYPSLQEWLLVPDDLIGIFTDTNCIKLGNRKLPFRFKMTLEEILKNRPEEQSIPAMVQAIENIVDTVSRFDQQMEKKELEEMGERIDGLKQRLNPINYNQSDKDLREALKPLKTHNLKKYQQIEKFLESSNKQGNHNDTFYRKKEIFVCLNNVLAKIERPKRDTKLPVL